MVAPPQWLASAHGGVGDPLFIDSWQRCLGLAACSTGKKNVGERCEGLGWLVVRAFIAEILAESSARVDLRVVSMFCGQVVNALALLFAEILHSNCSRDRSSWSGGAAVEW